MDSEHLAVAALQGLLESEWQAGRAELLREAAVVVVVGRMEALARSEETQEPV